MNKEFGKQNEKTDYELLKDFNKTLKLTELGMTPENYHTDASGYTTDGRYINIELKRRNIDINTYDTIFIETHKAGDMLLDYVCNKQIPLYINFLKDDYVVVFNLAELKSRPKRVCKFIRSELYDSFELAKRAELKLEDAWVYKKINNKYKLVRKP